MNYKLTTSLDGTKKIDFENGYTAVIIPTKDEKYAVCVSCQIGCPVGCKFCYTGKMGFKNNLTAEQIVDQVRTANTIIGRLKLGKAKLIPAEQVQLWNPTTVVFMGMGEPLLNLNNVIAAAEIMHKEFQLAYKHITISTSCLSNIKKLLDIPFNVALSLHSPFDEVRKKLIPSTITIAEIIEFAKAYCAKNRKRELMIEYALMKGVNDSDEDLQALRALQWPKKATFNFIEYNDLGEYKNSGRERLFYFKQAMIDAGFKSFIRYSRGPDIKAACGMLDVTMPVKFLSP